MEIFEKCFNYKVELVIFAMDGARRYDDTSAVWVLISAIIVFFMVHHHVWLEILLSTCRKQDSCLWRSPLLRTLSRTYFLYATYYSYVSIASIAQFFQILIQINT